MKLNPEQKQSLIGSIHDFLCDITTNEILTNTAVVENYKRLYGELNYKRYVIGHISQLINCLNWLLISLEATPSFNDFYIGKSFTSTERFKTVKEISVHDENDCYRLFVNGMNGFYAVNVFFNK